MQTQTSPCFGRLVGVYASFLGEDPSRGRLRFVTIQLVLDFGGAVPKRRGSLAVDGTVQRHLLSVVLRQSLNEVFAGICGIVPMMGIFL